MKIFVTGGTGFIGSHVIKALLVQGHEVVALRRPGSRTAIPLREEPNWVGGFLGDDLRDAMFGCEVLIHLAAYGVDPSHDSWFESFRWNVTASLAVWLQATEVKVRRLIVAGSCFEYGKAGERYQFIPPDAPLEPTTPYAASKAAATVAALALAVNRHVQLGLLRPFHVFGEGEAMNRFWPQLRNAALSGENFAMTRGQQIRDFVDVEYVATQFLFYATEAELVPGKPVVRNIGTGCPKTLLSFAEEWWQAWGAKGTLLPGTVPYRDNEVMRYVPLV